MISKNKVKFIKSLQLKKFRNEYNKFLIEGSKSVRELLLSDFILSELYVTEKFLEENHSVLKAKNITPEITNEEELAKVSSFSSNNAALAIAQTKPNQLLKGSPEEYTLVLDDIRDPGNLGTIIRIADWYGISNIICSETTTDFYSPKVIASSMGSFTRVKLYYCALEEYLSQTDLPVYAADLEGENVHHFSFPAGGLLLMGNESAGISPELVRFIRHKIHIPSFGGAESLNVAIATAVICDNIRRRS
jgi:TrmH family RNA methyltransferase